jgi:hypothetical protein
MKELNPRSRRPKQSQSRSTSKQYASYNSDPLRRSAEPTHRKRTTPSESRRTVDADGCADIGTRQALADQTHGLAALVWKYFETEIREVLMEVQDSLANLDADQAQD